ncbi:hypothetical protein PPERSA_05702 [Pseudocohnilembus persalinus]|uniref:Essential protein Yae1 N-terminal domain-containing protein n=1 Tax=Pseudocohnilembus persalinus TaxID=266149 RepID=A0A0V0QN01_PSEPJ|nr:hypothetical protein PPERSA_05702 [Pseudocohnilembus persalinus]|eukprot:KRX03344.1 hypothetical protein PPERSA_05702 [Pseudocohnilembus persalinus]
MSDSDDIWGDENDKNYQQQLAENEMKKVQNDIFTQGYRDAILDKSDTYEKQTMLKGINEGFEETQTIGYAGGIVFFVKNALKKQGENLSEQSKDNIQQIIQQLDSAQWVKQRSETELSVIVKNLIELLFQNDVLKSQQQIEEK